MIDLTPFCFVDQLKAIGEAIEAYETVRWPDRKINGERASFPEKGAGDA